MAKTKRTFYILYKDIFSLVRQGKLSITAIMIYTLLNDRYQYTKFKDELGNKYIIYTLAEFKEELNIKKDDTVYKAILELEKIKLIFTQKEKGKATKYYIKVP